MRFTRRALRGIRFDTASGYYDLAGTAALGNNGTKLWMALLLRPTTNSPSGNRYILGCEKATSPFNGFALRMLAGANAGRINFFCTSTVAPGFSCQGPSGTLDPTKPRWLMVVLDTAGSQHARMYAGDLEAPLTEVSYSSTPTNGGGNVDLDTATRIALGAIRVGGGAPLGTTDWDGDIWLAAYGVGTVPSALQIREFGIRQRPLPGEVIRLYPGRDGLARINDYSGRGHHGTQVQTTQTLAARRVEPRGGGIAVRTSLVFGPLVAEEEAVFRRRHRRSTLYRR